MRAELLGFRGTKIRIVNPQGKQALVRIASLSKSDQDFLANVRDQSAKAERSFEQGANALNNGLFAVAKTKLSIASELNKREIKSDFALGILSIGVDRDVKNSVNYFEECVNRWKSRRKVLTKMERANYAAALNNLALVKLRNRKIPESMKLWKEAITLQDETPQEIVQNLGTLSAFAVSNMKSLTAADIPLRRNQKKSMEELLSSIRLGKKAQPYQQGVGWLYMTYLNDKSIAEDKKPDHEDPNSKSDVVKVSPLEAAKGRVLRKLGTGTGFLIDDQYILTNRHVVLKDNISEPFNSYKISFGPKYDDAHNAELVSYSKSFDLGLLRVDSVPEDIKPIILFDGLAPLGTAVFAVGFPRGDEFGVGVTVTQGTISKHPLPKVAPNDPNREIKTAFWHDAIINSGNSGGPLVTKNGIAVGANFASLNPERDLIKSIKFTENYSIAVPSRDAVGFLKQTIANFPTTNELTDGSSLNDIQDSVVYIELLSDAAITHLPRSPNFPNAPGNEIPETRTVLQEFNAFEDRTCMACTGTQKRPCPNTDCKNGVIVSWVTDSVVRNFNGRAVQLNKKRKVTNQCPTCRGRKIIPCEFSRNGVDRRFQGTTSTRLNYRLNYKQSDSEE